MAVEAIGGSQISANLRKTLIGITDGSFYRESDSLRDSPQIFPEAGLRGGHRKILRIVN